MDIVDKVFEGLSLSDQAEKARKITAHQRKKELKKRQSLRLAVVGSAGVLILSAAITGVVTHLPQNSAADSEIRVNFTAEKQIEPEEITVKTEEDQAETDATAATENEAEAVETTSGATETTKTATTATKSTVKKSTAKKSNTDSNNTTTTTTTTTTTRSWIDSNAEKIDQGSTGENGCTVISGNVLYCKDAKTPTTTSAEEKTDQSQGDKGDVEKKDEGGVDESKAGVADGSAAESSSD